MRVSLVPGHLWSGGLVLRGTLLTFQALKLLEETIHLFLELAEPTIVFVLRSASHTARSKSDRWYRASHIRSGWPGWGWWHGGRRFCTWDWLILRPGLGLWAGVPAVLQGFGVTLARCNSSSRRVSRPRAASVRGQGSLGVQTIVAILSVFAIRVDVFLDSPRSFEFLTGLISQFARLFARASI